MSSEPARETRNAEQATAGYQGEACLVTGATGFVGSHLVDSLVRAGATVWALARQRSNLQWLRDKPVRLLAGDVRDAFTPEVIDALGSCRYLFHVAGAVTALRREDYFAVNADGTGKLLAAVAEAKAPLKRFVLISSLAAVGPGTGFDPITEEQDPHPVSWYGGSKLEAERIAREHGPSLPITIVRPPPVYGPRDRALLPLFRLRRRGFTLVPGGTLRANFVYITDLIEGILLAARSPRGCGETFHVGGQENAAVADTLGRMMSCVQRKTITLPLPVPLVHAAAFLCEIGMKMSRKPSILNLQKAVEWRQANWTMDISKARRILRYEPCVSLEEGGRSTFEWYQQAGWL